MRQKVQDNTRLIEVAFPLEQASLASVHEKNVRHGHISTLHIWPARRPLAACRAALLCTLLPDPGDLAKRKALLEKIGGTVKTTLKKKRGGNGDLIEEEVREIEGGVLKWGRENDPAMDELREMIREFYGSKVPRVLDPFAGGGAIPLEAMRLGCEVTAADINPVAWFILKCTLEYPQKFAGKKWRLPDFVKEWPDFVEDFLAGKVRKRRGIRKPHFSDPRQLQMLDLPDADLAWQVRAWGRWVLEKSRAELANYYPVIEGSPTLAYLWARTARDKINAARIPLLKTFWLCKRRGNRVAVIPLPNDEKTDVRFFMLREKELICPEEIIRKLPVLKEWGVSADTLEGFIQAGTMNRAGVWSPCSGRPGLISLTPADLRRQGQQQLLETRLMAVVVEKPSTTGKTSKKLYRLPTVQEENCSQVEEEVLSSIFAVFPDGLLEEPTPSGGGSGAARAFSMHNYGFTEWRHYFTTRQLLALGVFAKHTRVAIDRLKSIDSIHAEALSSALGIVFGKFADYMSVFCLWEPRNGEVKHTFARYAFPITWDFVEANPLTVSDRFYSGGTEVASKAFGGLLAAGLHARSTPCVLCESSLRGADAASDIVFTDPPYYDAIPYSDLMDFFFIWQKRIVGDLSPDFEKVFHRELGPKWDHAAQDGELIEDDARHNGDKKAARKAYELGMTKAFERCRAAVNEGGRFVVVFANKDVDAWETLVSAMIKGGFQVTASWPIRTEMPNKVTQKRANLASSVWIICRPRSRKGQPGWDTDVLDRMRDLLFSSRGEMGGINILQYFFDLGIRGPDFIWAALGPALQAYSAYPFVKKQAGGIMTVAEFLAEVRRLVLQFSLGELPGFRDVQRDTAGRGEGIELDPVSQYYLLHRAYFGLNPAPAGPCILYANACGKNEKELKVVWNILEQGGKSKRGRPRKDEEEATEAAASKGNEYRLLRWEERVKRESLGKTRAGQPAPLIDRLHRLMFLLQQNRASEMQGAYDGWGLASDNAFKPMLQAVRELADRDGQEAECRIVEALNTQLLMNRRTVVPENMVKEPALFEYGMENKK